jgi:hypothetical protein
VGKWSSGIHSVMGQGFCCGGVSEFVVWRVDVKHSTARRGGACEKGSGVTPDGRPR